MTASSSISQNCSIADPKNSTNNIPNTLKINADGSINSAAIVTPITSATLASSQVTVPATANGILILAANANRVGATISNPGNATVYIQQGSTGVTASNGFGLTPGSAYNIDTPLYKGAIYGIVSTGTNVVTVVELT